MKKRKIFSIIFLFVVFTSGCSYNGGNGYLIGVSSRPSWSEFYNPYGMVYINSGKYIMGENDQDVPYAHITKAKTVTVPPFFMDETEITNNEYRQFTNWVRDSIARILLGELRPEEFMITVDANGVELDEPIINWNVKIPWGSNDEEIMDALEPMYYTPEERFFSVKQIDIRKLIFKYEWIDYKMAASKGRLRHNFGQNEGINRSSFIKKKELNIYPDTLCWIADYTYAFNDPIAKMYFSHVAYDDYPVVGVSWEQAVAFSNWRTLLLNNFLKKSRQAILQDFRLPTESEWEYASRGGLNSASYPWGSYYIRNDKGCLLANFKVQRGNYIDDEAYYTAPAISYSPNDYGLFCMAGNVAEWTSSAYDESSYSFGHDLSMSYQYEATDDDLPVFKRKVIRGGSWKDISYYLNCGVRSYEYQDTAKAYIGFRNVMSYMGRERPVPLK